ncbi:COMPASS component SPP1 [Yarrowia sp. C11]|nr:COMPASS component SPP1 [Yarrowia sp. E02]KAG5367815.1 COMPASS component SPP1 [Yarrowia sp. C11]
MSSNDATSDDTDATVEEDFKREPEPTANIESNPPSDPPVENEDASDSDEPSGGGFSYSLLKKTVKKGDNDKTEPATKTEPIVKSDPAVKPEMLISEAGSATPSFTESPRETPSDMMSPDPGYEHVPSKASKRRQPKPKARPAPKKKQKVAHSRDYKLPPGAPPVDTSHQGDDDHQELFCVCRRPDDGKWMIGCDYCEEWIHGTCVGMTPARAKLMHKFCCPFCTRKAEKMRVGEETTVTHQMTLKHGTETTWKRVCRLEECHKAVSYPSKYCCREHGLEYMKGRVAALSTNSNSSVADDTEEPFGKLSEERLAAIVKQTPVVASFKTLGSTAPVETSPVTPKEPSTQLKFVEQKLKYLTLIKDRTKSLSEEAATAAGVRKKDLCGYDARLDKDHEVWANEYAEKDELVGVAMSEDPTKTITPSHNTLHNKEHICFQEKRKCYNHLGWAALITDQLNLQRAILQREMERSVGDEADLREIERLRNVEKLTWVK